MKWKRLTENAIKGMFLIVVLWIVNVFIAFFIFKPIDEHTLAINISWLAADVGIYLVLLKVRYVNMQVNLFAILTILLLVGLYLTPINNNIPKSAADLNNNLSQNPEKYQYAKNLFYEIEKKWTSPTRQYLLEPHKIFFIRDFEYFWNTEGYVDSNMQAQIYRKLLVSSGRFRKDEVLLKQKWCVNSPHGVIVIKHPKGNIYADFWAVDGFPRKGVTEEYYFGQYTIRPCDKLVGEQF